MKAKSLAFGGERPLLIRLSNSLRRLRYISAKLTHSDLRKDNVQARRCILPTLQRSHLLKDPSKLRMQNLDFPMSYLDAD